MQIVCRLLLLLQHSFILFVFEMQPLMSPDLRNSPPETTIVQTCLFYFLFVCVYLFVGCAMRIFVPKPGTETPGSENAKFQPLTARNSLDTFTFRPFHLEVSANTGCLCSLFFQVISLFCLFSQDFLCGKQQRATFGT